MQQRRVKEEGLRVVNFFDEGRKRMNFRVTVPQKQATANYVPAAAVIRRWQALSGFTGCKGRVDGKASQM